jgi:hypothetical protein
MGDYGDWGHGGFAHHAIDREPPTPQKPPSRAPFRPWADAFWGGSKERTGRGIDGFVAPMPAVASSSRLTLVAELVMCGCMEGSR